MKILNKIIESNNLNYKITPNGIESSSFNGVIEFFEGHIKLGFIDYVYGEPVSDALDGYKELYIDFIKVDVKGRGLSSYMLDVMKEYASHLGANLLTLKVDYGVGYGSCVRTPHRYLDKLYIKNGFKYLYTEEQFLEDGELNVGAMYYMVQNI